MSDAAFSQAGVGRVSLIHLPPAVCAFRAQLPGVRATPRAEVSPEAPDSDAYASGFAEGERAAAAHFAADRAALQRLLADLEVFQPEPSEELAAMIAATVGHLVSRITGSAAIDRDWLAARIARAITSIEAADAARTLWLHPDDAALIGDTGLGDTGIPLAISCDVALERGAFRIECSQGWVEDSRSVHLDALRAQLGMDAAV